ncbi:MAG: pyridoxamine 5'-phosphate oxidase family protein, partial [Desulfotignum sp.]
MDSVTGFTENDIEQLQPTEKVGLLATVNSEGQPHITLITSLQPLDKNHLVFGQFAKGRSKKNIRRNPKTAFLLMTLDRSMWRGTADYTHLRTEGPEYRMFNEKPMFRYNAYFGINTVYYFDLKTLGSQERLPLAAIIRATLATKLAKSAAAAASSKTILNPMSEKMFNMAGALRFISWVGEDGYPALVPAIQCQAAD